MRNTAFLVVGLLLLVVQANLFRVLDHLPLHGATPSLVLPIIVFMGVHEYSMARGAALACVLGYAVDLLAGAPIGMFAFVSVVIFTMARAAGVRLVAQTMLTQVALAFAFALVEGVTVLALLAVFGRDPLGPRALVSSLVPHALATAVVAPFVFRLAERLHQATSTAPRSDVGGVR